MIYDYLIIGSGIAGLYTAQLAAQRGRRVLLVTKEAVEECNTRYAQGGIAAAIGAEDSPELHIADTLAAGAGLSDPAAVAVLCREGPARIRELIELGVPFDTYHGEIALTREAAHSRRRILHAGGDATGAAIETTLLGVVRNTPVDVRDYHVALAIVVERGRAVGVRVLNARTGDEEHIEAHRVVLATGGAGQLYQATTNPAVATGDGVGLAYTAGAAVANLEFFQFHPTALRLPGAPGFLISEAVRGEGGVLRNEAGERFMLAVHPDAELAPRDIVARGIAAEMVRSGADHVYLDVTHLAPELLALRFPTIARFCAQYGIDISKDPIPVAPAAHYLMGGVLTDLHARTTIPGLYAVGEVAMTGVHGANRLASNSLLEVVVFARRLIDAAEAGPAAPAEPLRFPHTELSGPDLSTARGTADPAELRRVLQQLMWRSIGIVREGAGLRAAGQQIAAWRTQAPPIRDVETAELQHLLLVGELMAWAALAREESRGAHYRSDFPELREEWRRYLVLRHP